MIIVSFRMREITGIPPMVTLAVRSKPAPRMITCVLPSTGPLLGRTLVTARGWPLSLALPVSPVSRAQLTRNTITKCPLLRVFLQMSIRVLHPHWARRGEEANTQPIGEARKGMPASAQGVATCRFKDRHIQSSYITIFPLGHRTPADREAGPLTLQSVF